MIEQLGGLAALHRDVAQGGHMRNTLKAKPLAGSPAVLKHRMRHRPCPGFCAKTTSGVGRAPTFEAVDSGLCIAG